MDFHIVDTIREYGAINGYTTETYESLHKSYVKTPYRLSNKKGIEEQIMKTIRRKAIIKRRVTEELHKTPTALIYTSKLFEFKLLEASIFFEQQKKNPDLTENMIKGFAKFLECLDLFFDMLDIISAEDCRIKIFGSVTLKNINILRATNKFQNRPWFSNIAIAMDDAELFEYQSDNGTCYAQTLLITEVILPNKSPFHLALVQWYDFKSKKTPFVYDCPLLKLVEIYNFIEIEAIEEIVHIVPRFDTKDEYFELIEQTSRMAQHGIKGLFVKYVFDNPVTAVKSSGATHGVVRWAEILGVIVLFGVMFDKLKFYVTIGLLSEWLGGWYVGTKEVFGGALLPTTALDARGAHGGSRRGSESVSIKQRFGRSQLPVTLYEE
ncbi:hypothetical protein Glove_142g39 [Diversispora epigaea]|uniref:Uncharacterized protein n=1 Tax=Diversispora epigaea TaxID=1348612 RepID=A0A397J3P6_9GLOM|nr:hypothetical protein Glove_142g39 [Diversispora epigaea]